MHTFGLVRDQEINMLMVWWDCSSELTLDLVTPYWEKNGQIKQMKHLMQVENQPLE